MVAVAITRAELTVADLRGKVVLLKVKVEEGAEDEFGLGQFRFDER